jgi:hypothetical protein
MVAICLMFMTLYQCFHDQDMLHFSRLLHSASACGEENSLTRVRDVKLRTWEASKDVDACPDETCAFVDHFPVLSRK